MTEWVPAKKHIIKLSPEERTALEQVSQSNRRSEREKRRARLLLGSDTSLSREQKHNRHPRPVALHNTRRSRQTLQALS